MNEQAMRIMLATQAEQYASILTDDELSVLGNVIGTGYPATPAMRGYDKWKGLLTQDNGTRVHRDMIPFLMRIIVRRFSER